MPLSLSSSDARSELPSEVNRTVLTRPAAALLARLFSAIERAQTARVYQEIYIHSPDLYHSLMRQHLVEGGLLDKSEVERGD